MMGPWQAVALMALSLSLMHVIVYLAGFAGQEEQGHPVTAFFHFTLAGYGLVLLTCAFILWVFGALDGHSLAVTVDALIVLAFPGAIGFCFCTSADLMTKTAPKTSASKPSAKPDSSTDTPWLAWMMGGLGLTLVVACLSIILWRATSTVQDPDIQLRLVEARAPQGQWLAQIEAHDAGGETAADVEIKGAIGDESAAALIDYLPASGKRTVMLGFTEDPRQGLELRTHGWIEP